METKRRAGLRKETGKFLIEKNPLIFSLSLLSLRNVFFYQGQGESDYSANAQQVLHQTFTFAAANYLTPAESSYQGLYISLQTGKTTRCNSCVSPTAPAQCISLYSHRISVLMEVGRKMSSEKKSKLFHQHNHLRFTQ